MNKPVTLYDCLNARYPAPLAEYVRCSKGHKLGTGYIHKRQVDRGDNLICRVCQTCQDFISMEDNDEH